MKIKYLLCGLLFPLVASAGYPPDGTTHLLQPTFNNPKVIQFTVPQADLQGLPPSKGDFVICSVELRNPQSCSSVPKARIQLSIDNYRGAYEEKTFDIRPDQYPTLYEAKPYGTTPATVNFIVTALTSYNPVVLVKCTHFKEPK